MSNTGLTAGDILALTRGGDGFLEGNGIIILILFFLIFGNWGRSNERSVPSDVVTTSQLYSSIGSQNLMNDVRSGFASMSAAQCGTDKEILNNRFTSQLGFQNLSSQMNECCCSTKQLIMEENQKTRDLIQANYIDGLRTALSDAKDEISNLNQTKNILDTTGRWVGYAGIGSCSCSCGYNNLV